MKMTRKRLVFLICVIVLAGAAVQGVVVLRRWGPRAGRSPHIPLISAYARGTVNRLPAGERETEEKEIEELLAQLSCESQQREIRQSFEMKW